MSGRPLRICMVTTFYPPWHHGGDGIFVRRLSHALADRGHRVEVVHSIDAYRLRARQPHPDEGGHPGVTVHGIESPLGALALLAGHQTGRPLGSGRRLRTLLDSGFDLVNYHNVSLIGGPSVLGWGGGVKLYTAHEHWLVCPTHVMLKHGREPCRKPSCVACQLTHGRPPQLWRYGGLLERAAGCVDTFLHFSRFSEQLHRERGLRAPATVLRSFAPARAGADDDCAAVGGEPVGEPYFLFVGRLERLKGLHTILPFFRRWGRARLLVAGSGPEEESLRRQAEGSPHIEFLGRCTEERLDGLYRGCVALIVPSLCFEIAPLVILEAFRQGAPVIVRDLGGLPELPRESGGGLTFGSLEELESAAEELLLDPDKRNRLGNAGRDAWRREWTEEAYVDRYLGIVESLRAGPAREKAARAGGAHP